MAKISVEVIEALRVTADKLEKAADYQWGYMGSCNCGFLAQQITHLSKHEIHRRAMQRYGDWNEQLNDYCPTSGWPMDDLIHEMIAFGFDVDDLKHLEKLSDPTILRTLPVTEGNLHHNIKADVVQYLTAWSHLLEHQLLNTVHLPSFEIEKTLVH